MKRNLFAELAEGFEALAEEREGKRTLRPPSSTLAITRAGRRVEVQE